MGEIGFFEGFGGTAIGEGLASTLTVVISKSGGTAGAAVVVDVVDVVAEAELWSAVPQRAAPRALPAQPQTVYSKDVEEILKRLTAEGYSNSEIGGQLPMGGREPQLRVHLGAALNVGLTAEQLEEVIIQTVPYAGFPTAINALNLLKQVVAEAPRPGSGGHT